MKLPELPKKQSISLTAFRNIYTIKASQDLFDDLADAEDFPTLQAWDNATSQIDHSKPLLQRNFQYGEVESTIAVFNELKWRPGRFGDGTYGVWYGARDKHTSIMESLFWSYRFAKEDIAKSRLPVVIDRKMFEAECKSDSAVDLTGLSAFLMNLTSEDYEFCQALGAFAVRSKIELYLSPSARNAGGICMPVFNSEAIQSDRMLYFFHFTFTSDGKAQITTDEDAEFTIPGTWK